MIGFTQQALDKISNIICVQKIAGYILVKHAGHFWIVRTFFQGLE